MKRSRRVPLLIALCVSVAAFTGTDRALRRHLQLLKSVPAKGAVIEAPPESIRFWFSEAPEIRVTRVSVTLPGGVTVELEGIHAAEDDAKVVIAPFADGGSAGTYGVAWRTMSRDGHVVRGEFQFRIEPAR